MQKKKILKKKKETCFSYIEITRSEFCTIAKKQISLTKTAVKEKALEITKKYPKNKDVILEKENDLTSSYFQSKKISKKTCHIFSI